MSITDSPVRNGIDTATLFANVDAIREHPEAAVTQFRATNRWVSGTHSQSRIDNYFAVGAEHTRPQAFLIDADHPEPFVGTDKGPNPIELVLAALASCITAGIGSVAAARKIDLTSVESTVVGDTDLRGVLGLDPNVRNGLSTIRLTVRIDGDASPEQLRKVVDQARDRSAVYDMLTNGVPVDIDVSTA
jgi:uncharacterized OsmC-like protein